jgi:hypothetical protein
MAKKTENQAEIPKGRTFKKEIIVDLPKENQQDKHERLAEVDRAILESAAAKAAANGEFNAELKELRKEQKTILDTLTTGKETIEVDCYEEIDERRLEILTRRVDTNDVLHEFTRPMTAEERQVCLPTGGEAA